MCDQAGVHDPGCPGREFPTEVGECEHNKEGGVFLDRICQGWCVDVSSWCHQTWVIQDVDGIRAVVNALIGGSLGRHICHSPRGGFLPAVG